MNEEEEKILTCDDEQGMPSQHEELMIRRAMRRRKVVAPDVEQEWQLFKAAHLSLASEKRKAHIVGFLLGVAVSVAVFLLLYPLLKPDTPQQSVANGVQIFSANNEPTEVMLTQDKGKPVAVKEGNLVFSKDSTKQEAVSLKKSPQKMLTLKTPRGKDYKVTLSDGTQVWMNAESKLEFPEKFNGHTREVILHGEAYFEVAKNAKQPFIVKTDYFHTKVLGTSFNIRAYSERDANVVLVEGSVAMTTKRKGQEPIILKPNQQATLQARQSALSIKEVDTYPYTQWRDGFFYFDDTPMIEIMQELGRWYNINIIFEEAKYMNTHLHFVAERRLPLATVIRNINDLGIVKVEIQKDAVIVN